MDGPMLKLGDASIAAAFTARSASVTSCVSVILQALPSCHPYATSRPRKLHVPCLYLLSKLL
jgi:hypothetical protein